MPAQSTEELLALELSEDLILVSRAVLESYAPWRNAGEVAQEVLADWTALKKARPLHFSDMAYFGISSPPSNRHIQRA